MRAHSCFHLYESFQSSPEEFDALLRRFPRAAQHNPDEHVPTELPLDFPSFRDYRYSLAGRGAPVHTRRAVCIRFLGQLGRIPLHSDWSADLPRTLRPKTLQPMLDRRLTRL